MSDVLLYIGGKPVYIDEEDEQEHLSWTGEYTIDGDGHPQCYGPSGTAALDYLGNAGHPGNWWGVATDNQESYGDPVVQGSQNSCPGFYVSTTAYVVPGYYWYDPRRYLHSGEVPFMVIPGNVRTSCRGICKGCKGKVTDKKSKKSMEVVVGDIGPSDHMGEGSMKLAEFFGLDPSPKHGGSSDESRFYFECWPGIAAEGFILQS